MGSDQSKVDKTQEQINQVKAKTYDEFNEQVSVIARLASKNKDDKIHSHLTFRVEPSRDRLKMPSLWQREVCVIVTTVPDLPDFWECRLSPDNRPYYINHAQQSTQWMPPWEIPYAPILAQPPVNMVKRLTFPQWTLAYAKIFEAAGDPIQLAAKLDPMYGLKELPGAPQGGANAAINASGKSEPPSADPVDEDELCVVCMERPPKIVLPCGHSFCKECISEWKGKSDTCPVCRASVTAGGAEEWVMAGEPSPSELAQFITDFLRSLDEKTLKKADSYMRS